MQKLTNGMVGLKTGAVYYAGIWVLGILKRLYYCDIYRNILIIDIKGGSNKM